MNLNARCLVLEKSSGIRNLKVICDRDMCRLPLNVDDQSKAI